MNLDTLYKKRFLYIKVLYALAITPIVFLISRLFDSTNPFLFFFFAVFAIGLLYALPLVAQLTCIRKERPDRVIGFVLLDAITLLVPCLLSIVLTDALFSVLQSDKTGAGFFSLVALPVLVILSVVIWVLYRFFRGKPRSIR